MSLTSVGKENWAGAGLTCSSWQDRELVGAVEPREEPEGSGCWYLYAIGPRLSAHGWRITRGGTKEQIKEAGTFLEIMGF